MLVYDVRIFDRANHGKRRENIRMRGTWAKVGILSLLLTVALPGAAFAHVTVSPEEVQPGVTQKFTVVVPTEKEIPTTGVSLEIPDGFEVSSVPSPSGGWRGGVEDGAVAWSGGEIGAAEFEITSPEGEIIPMGESQEFTFEARAPEAPGAYAWPASQTYENGSVVEWAGPADSEDPAPVVRIAATGPEGTTAEGAGHHHDPGTGEHGHGAGNGQAGNGQAADEPEGNPNPPYVLLGVGVLAAGAATAGVAVLRGKSRGSGTTGRRPGP